MSYSSYCKNNNIKKIVISRKNNSCPLERPFTQNIHNAIVKFEKACKALGIIAEIYDFTYAHTARKPSIWCLGTVIYNNNSSWTTFVNIQGYDIIYASNDTRFKDMWIKYEIAPKYINIIGSNMISMSLNEQRYLDIGRANAEGIIMLPDELFQIIIKKKNLNWFDFHKLAMVCPDQFRDIILKYLMSTNKHNDIFAILEWPNNKILENTYSNIFNNISDIMDETYLPYDNFYPCIKSHELAVDYSYCLIATVLKHTKKTAVWDLATGKQLFTIGVGCQSVYIYNTQYDTVYNNKSNAAIRFKKIRRFIKTHCKGINKARDWIIILAQDVVINDITIEMLKDFINSRIKWYKIALYKVLINEIKYGMHKYFKSINDIYHFVDDNIIYKIKQYSKLVAYYSRLSKINDISELKNNMTNIDLCYIYSQHNKLNTKKHKLVFIPLNRHPVNGYYSFQQSRYSNQQIVVPEHNISIDSKYVNYIMDLMQPYTENNDDQFNVSTINIGGYLKKKHVLVIRKNNPNSINQLYKYNTYTNNWLDKIKYICEEVIVNGI